MLKSFTLAAGAICMTLMAVPALAQTQANADSADHDHRPHPPRFDDLDTNHDGQLNFDEFTAPLLKHARDRFDAMDTNHDGVVSKEEFKAFMHEHRHHGPHGHPPHGPDRDPGHDPAAAPPPAQ